jgi:hypothetical protein
MDGANRHEGGQRATSNSNINTASMLRPQQNCQQGASNVLPQQQQQQHQQQSMPPHLMGLMTNPQLAAAAAASPLFPPAAMISNPGAYFSMPEAYAAGAMQAQLRRNNPGNNGTGSNNSSNNNMLLPSMSMMQSGHHHPFMDSRNMVFGPNMVVPPAPPQVYMDNNNNANTADLSVAQRSKQNRDRNKEHAKSTRMRKKAYVSKLKDLVEGLHSERTEETRQRRVAIQHLSEVQNVRKHVVRSFLQYFSSYEMDSNKWLILIEKDDFWLKEPVTPYRSFRRCEIEQVGRLNVRDLPFTAMNVFIIARYRAGSYMLCCIFR